MAPEFHRHRTVGKSIGEQWSKLTQPHKSTMNGIKNITVSSVNVMPDIGHRMQPKMGNGSGVSSGIARHIAVMAGTWLVENRSVVFDLVI